MAAYSESELRYARPLASSFLQDVAFRNWVLQGTPHHEDYHRAVPLGEAQRILRSPTIRNPYWFNYWCGKDSRCECRIGTGIETDILIVLERADSRRLGVHIEVKRPGEHLGNGQAASYPRRAACWANPKTKPRTVPLHQDFVTLLVCGRELVNHEQAIFFDKIICHDEVEQHIGTYPELPTGTSIPA